MDIPGGEPFVRKDLADILRGNCELKKDGLKKLKSVAITTNGLLTRQVLAVTEGILPLEC
jgi:molybdenum cofactor biosynthesis enzyme MoaA